MRASRRSAVYRVFSAAVIALLLIALLSGNALAAGTDGLTVETLTFRDVLALYAADRDSFGENASETDGDGVTNAAKRLAEMFTFTVGLNYAGEGLNCNYFGKDISAQMGAEPYTDANRLASYDVEILPYRSYAVALPQGQTTTISVYLAGYTNAAASGGVEAVLHYVWQDQGVWYAVKDDNPYYRIRFNGKSARALAADGLAMALAHAENGTAAIGAGILAEYALACLDRGMDAAGLARALEQKRQDVCVLALVDTLEYLKRGGRISKTTALAGGLLNIKPVLTIENGEILLVGKARGSRQGNNLLVEKIHACGGIDFSLPILLGYTGLTDVFLKKYVEDSRALWENGTDRLDSTLIGGVIGTHAGPGAVAVAFFRKK